MYRDHLQGEAIIEDIAKPSSLLYIRLSIGTMSWSEVMIGYFYVVFCCLGSRVADIGLLSGAPRGSVVCTHCAEISRGENTGNTSRMYFLVSWRAPNCHQFGGMFKGISAQWTNSVVTTALFVRWYIVFKPLKYHFKIKSKLIVVWGIMELCISLLAHRYAHGTICRLEFYIAKPHKILRFFKVENWSSHLTSSSVVVKLRSNVFAPAWGYTWPIAVVVILGYKMFV